jgi:hypothetical protein
MWFCFSFKTQRFGDWILDFKEKRDNILDKDKTMDNVQKRNICIKRTVYVVNGRSRRRSCDEPI